MALDFGGIIQVFIPMIVVQLQKALDEGLDKIHAKNPKLHKTVVVIGHFTLVTYAEEIIKDTTNPYDDIAVKAIIEELEKNAKEHGITLAS